MSCCEPWSGGWCRSGAWSLWDAAAAGVVDGRVAVGPFCEVGLVVLCRGADGQRAADGVDVDGRGTGNVVEDGLVFEVSRSSVTISPAQAYSVSVSAYHTVSAGKRSEPRKGPEASEGRKLTCPWKRAGGDAERSQLE